MALNVDLALIVLYFLIGVFCGYAIFGTQPIYKFQINLHKDGKKPLLTKTPGFFDTPEVEKHLRKITEDDAEKLYGQKQNTTTVSKGHENKVNVVVKQAKEHFKNLGGNA